ncbi:MAG: methyltransferase family protein [Gemmatimonadales bacterium]
MTRPPVWAVLAAPVFASLFIGTLLVYVPGTLAGWQFQPPFLGWPWVRWLGAATMALGAPLCADAITRFVARGHGTPAPFAPPRHLVISGFYRHVRNPMYLGAGAVLLGEALLLGSHDILLYLAALAVVIHLFVMLYEEPTLRRKFGDEYRRYCAEVPRWLPRFRPPA